MAIEYFSPSPLSHFDPADLLDGLSTGVIVLDAHLCVVYANVGAQDLLAVGLNQARGRPLTQLFDDSQALDLLLRRSLERGEPYAGHEIPLTPSVKQGHREPVVVDVTVTPLEGQVTGTHLLIELADARTRQRISRESEMLSRLDGSRLMIRQLGHEIKNPLGGLRGAAQLLDRELHDGSLKEYTTVIINEADRLRALADSMVDPASGRVTLRTRVLTNFNIGTVRHRLVANIQVEDNGHGVPPELQRSVFYPLVTSRSTGTGLGLAVAQDLVARHRGIVEFESRPGHTLFSVLLPLEGAE